MKACFRVLEAFALLGAAPWAASGQSFSPPVLGYVWDASSRAVKTIAGVPGASNLEAAFSWNGGAIVIAPRGRFGLAASKGLILVDWTGGTVSERSLAAAEDNATIIAFSPSGRSAAAYFKESGRLRVWTGLPSAPALETDIQATVSDGALMTLADDAQALALLADGKLMRIGSEGLLSAAEETQSFSAIAFRPGTRELAAAAESSVVLFPDFSRGGSPAEVSAVRAAALGFSADGSTLLAAIHEDESIALIDLRTRTAAAFPCSCRPEGFYPVAGNAVFRLSNSAKGNLALFDGDREEPRIVLVAAPALGGVE